MKDLAYIIFFGLFCFWVLRGCQDAGEDSGSRTEVGQTAGTIGPSALPAYDLRIVGKIILVDLKYWITDYHSVVEWIRKA